MIGWRNVETSEAARVPCSLAGAQRSGVGNDARRALGRRRLPAGAAGLPIAGLAFDSRAVKPGDLFFAVAGTHADGLAYAERAIRAGAAAIVAEREPDEPLGAPTIIVADARAALAAAAARFYPGAPETTVAVTGTAGKTSVSDFTRQIFTALGHKAASLGTLGVIEPGHAVYGSLDDARSDPAASHARRARA